MKAIAKTAPALAPTATSVISLGDAKVQTGRHPSGGHYLDEVRIKGVDVSNDARRLLLHHDFTVGESAEVKDLAIIRPRSLGVKNDEQFKDMQLHMFSKDKRLHFCDLSEIAPSLCLKFVEDPSVVEPGQYFVCCRHAFGLGDIGDRHPVFGYSYGFFKIMVSAEKSVRLDAVIHQNSSMTYPRVKLDDFMVFERR